MRTTVDIEGPVLKQLRVIQKREGVTLGALVSRLLATALAQNRQAVNRTPFQWTARPMGVRVDLQDKESVYAILDRADRAAEP